MGSPAPGPGVWTPGPGPRSHLIELRIRGLDPGSSIAKQRSGVWTHGPGPVFSIAKQRSGVWTHGPGPQISAWKGSPILDHPPRSSRDPVLAILDLLCARPRAGPEALILFIGHYNPWYLVLDYRAITRGRGDIPLPHPRWVSPVLAKQRSSIAKQGSSIAKQGSSIAKQRSLLANTGSSIGKQDLCLEGLSNTGDPPRFKQEFSIANTEVTMCARSRGTGSPHSIHRALQSGVFHVPILDRNPLAR